MASTPNFGITYPDGASQVTPIQTPFAALASSVDDALTELAGSIPNQSVASYAERDALFPNPAQGTTVYVRNKGWSERYYNLFNASTNPGGALTAGWHAIDIKPSGASSAIVTPSSGWAQVSDVARRFGPLAFLSYSFKRTGAKIVVPNSGNINNVQIGTLNSSWASTSGAVFPMAPTSTGRLAAGSLSGTTLTFSAVQGPNDIAVNETFNLSGWYILANP